MPNTIGDLLDSMDTDDNLWVCAAAAMDGHLYAVVIDGMTRTPICHSLVLHFPVNLQDACTRALTHGEQWLEDTPIYGVAHILDAQPIAIVQYLGADA